MDGWLRWLYHYGVGSAVFVISLAVPHRAGAIRWNRPADRRLVIALAAGLRVFWLAHAIWLRWAHG